MKGGRVLLAHGSGGRMSQQLIENVFKQAWDNPFLAPMLDGAVLELPAGRAAMTTDSFVTTPTWIQHPISKVNIRK
jgi:hydrogenase expression/formation protein HypE